MSADEVPPLDEIREAEPTESAAHVQVDCAAGSLVASVDESHPFPTLVLRNDRHELHLEPSPERLDEILSQRCPESGSAVRRTTRSHRLRGGSLNNIKRHDLPLPPGLTAFLVNARHAQSMRQEGLALELGMSGRQYRAWESARQAIPRARLDDLARALRLDEVGRRQLYRLTGHLVHLPGALSGNARLLQLTETWTNVHIHRHSDPACLTDGAWNVVAANHAYVRLFEAVSPHPLNHPTVNTLRWILFHPDAPHMLGEWQNSWMLPTLSQFALAFQNTQTDPQLRRIREEIARHPDLEEAYLRKVPTLLAQPTEYPDDEDGVVREILTGSEGYASALLTTAIPSHARDHGFRAVTMSVVARGGEADQQSHDPVVSRQHSDHTW